MKKEPKFKTPIEKEVWRLTNRVIRIETDLMHANEAFGDLLNRLDEQNKRISILESARKVQIVLNSGFTSLLKSLTKKEKKAVKEQVKVIKTQKIQTKKQSVFEKWFKKALRK